MLFRSSLLRKQVDEAGAKVKILRQDLGKVSSELATRKDENRQLRTVLHDVKEETSKLRLQVRQRDMEQIALNKVIRNDLRILLDERQHARWVCIDAPRRSQKRRAPHRTQAATFGALGTSLADVAAFMHEVELGMGMLSQNEDQRGVHRLRLLALRMTSLPDDHR